MAGARQKRRGRGNANGGKGMDGKTGAKRLTRDALLTALALILFLVEAQIPAPVPIPGVKLGLANVVTIWSIFLLGPADTLLVLLSRILLGSLFAGQLLSLFYSLSGGLLCFLVTLVLRRAVTKSQIWVCGVFGAVAHNAGQLAAAILLMAAPSLLAYFPVLMISGVITGLFTGFCAQFLICRSLWRMD